LTRLDLRASTTNLGTERMRRCAAHPRSHLRRLYESLLGKLRLPSRESLPRVIQGRGHVCLGPMIERARPASDSKAGSAAPSTTRHAALRRRSHGAMALERRASMAVPQIRAVSPRKPSVPFVLLKAAFKDYDDALGGTPTRSRISPSQGRPSLPRTPGPPLRAWD